MNIKDFILAEIQPLENGHTYTMSCPVCNGKGKFTVTVNDSIVLYNCYRASCIGGGMIPLNLTPEQRINALKMEKKPIVEAWRVPDYWIDGIGGADCVNYMHQMHMWQAFKDGIFRPYYDPALRRFVFPIKNPQGDVVGAIGRSLGGASPKSLNYNKNYPQPFVCGMGPNREEIVLVEDCASAVAATRQPAIAGMALLGTSIREDFIPYLSSYKQVHIALDKDAWSKSLRLQKQLSPYIKHINILRLPKDIKDMSNLEYDNFYKNGLVS